MKRKSPAQKRHCQKTDQKVNPSKAVKPSIPWHRIDAEIRNSKNEIIYSMKNIQAPVSWSSTAVEIAASKYFRKKFETSILQLVQRVVGAIKKSSLQQGYFDKMESDHFAQELEEILLHQKAMFNSPVWFNCGLFESYGLKADIGLFAWDQKKRKVQFFENGYLHPQISACFIQSIQDDLESIFDFAKKEAKIFKYGSGSGANFSSLRSRYEELSSGGLSSGVLAFLDVLDRGAGAIKSGGITRRAAKMVCLDVDHPEILDFIQWKVREENKARSLIQAGYPSDYEGEAYRTISGQNANNSVRITSAFLKALEKDSLWALRGRVTLGRESQSKKGQPKAQQKSVKGPVIKKVPASEIWQSLTQAAWDCADPGVQFHDTIQKWHTCPQDGNINASNPCSEYMFLDDSACNLASLNLNNFLREDQEFDVAAFRKTAHTVFTAQDILIDYAGYPTEQIAENSHRFRPLGLGLCGLGGFLMSLGISYDSDEGRACAGFLSSLLLGEALLTSVELAKKLGPYEGFARNRKSHLKVLKLHKSALQKIQWSLLPADYQKLVRGIFQLAEQGAHKYGLRNSQHTVMAPTGTIGLVMDCDTTGIEPEYSLIKFKKMVGGGVIKMVSQAFEKGLENLGYSGEVIKKIQSHLEKGGSLETCSDLKAHHRSVFLTAQPNGDSAAVLSPESHLKMMAAIQPFVSGAISKTVNLPASATPEDISKIYKLAFQLGLKSISVYRDQSKSSQPLSLLKNLTCPECGGKTEIAGNCYRCINCGFTTGCVS